MNRTATAPACHRSSTLLQTQMIANQFTTVVVDVNRISSLNGHPDPTPWKTRYPRSKDLLQTLERLHWGTPRRVMWSSEQTLEWFGRTQRGWRKTVSFTPSLGKHCRCHRMSCSDRSIYSTASREAWADTATGRRVDTIWTSSLGSLIAECWQQQAYWEFSCDITIDR